METTTIITCGDGGLQGAFIDGALSHMYSVFPHVIAETQHVFATSASVATFMYYIGENGPITGKKIWTLDIPDSSFLAFTSTKSLFSGEPIYNIDHLIEVIFRTNNPLDAAKAKATTVHFAFPILNLGTRQVEIFSNQPKVAQTFFPNHTIRNWLEYDIYDLIKASCAIPILYDRPVKLGNHSYTDAGISHPIIVPDSVPVNTRALYITSGIKPQWRTDLKVSLAALIWWVRALMGKTGLPHWVYLHIMVKPFTNLRLARKLARLINPHLLITPHKLLSSTLTNTRKSSLYNWEAGHEHITQRHTEFTQYFGKS